MKYKEYVDKRQAEFDALPVFFAYSNDQLEEELAKRGLSSKKKSDLAKIARLSAGGFFLKEDRPAILAFLKNDTLKELMKDAAFAKDAFRYEMYNHEYPINWEGDYDVVSIFYNVEFEEGKSWKDYLEEAGCDEKIIGAFASARAEVMRKAY